MKKISLIILMLILTFPTFSNAENIFRIDLSGNYESVEKVILNGNQFLRKQQVRPIPRRHHTMVTINGKDYIYGGYDGTYALNDLWEYDTITNEWNKKSDSPPDGRQGHLAAVHNGEMYIFGGATNHSEATKDIMKYNPETDIWTVLNNAPFNLTPRNHGSGAVNENKWYIFAGHTAMAGVINDLSDLWVYDFNSKTWTQKKSNFYRRSAQSSAFLDGKMYSFGGDSNHSSNALISIYNPQTDMWEDVNAGLGYLHKPSVVVAGNNIYIYAGNNPSNTSDLRIYNPQNYIFASKANGLETVNSCAIVADGGKIRIFGGNNFDAVS